MVKIFSKCMVVTAVIVATLFIGWNQIMRAPEPDFHVIHYKYFDPESKEYSCLYKYITPNELRKFVSIFASSKLTQFVEKPYNDSADEVLISFVTEDWKTIFYLTESGKWFSTLAKEIFTLDPAGIEDVKHTLIEWHKNREKKCQTTVKQYSDEIMIKLNSAPGRRAE